MILDIDDKKVAFGMRWETLLDAGSPHKLAKKKGSQLMWYDKPTSHTVVGLLAERETLPKSRKEIYSGAMMLANLFKDDANVLMICAIPPEAEIVGGEPTAHSGEQRYVVCGLYEHWPSRNFDVANVTSQEVSRLHSEFVAMCSRFTLVGNVPYENITPLDIYGLVESATPDSLLKSVRGITVDPKKAIALTVVIAGGFFGTRYYLDYTKQQKLLEASRAERSSQDIYSEVMARKRNAGGLAARDIGPLVDWIRDQSTNVGGWKLKRIACNVQESRKVICAADYQRSPLILANNESFLKYTTVPPGSVSFDINAVQVHTATAIDAKITFTKLGSAMDAAKTQRDQIVNFGAELQRLTVFGETKLTDYSVYALPTGINANQLSRPVMAATWAVSGPLRITEALRTFPANVMVQKFVVSIENLATDYKLANSFARISVDGIIFSKT